MNKSFAFIAFVAIVTMLVSCGGEKSKILDSRLEALHEASKMVTLTASSEKTQDMKVILGFELGMSSTDAYKYIKKLNRTGTMRRMQKADDLFEYVYDEKLAQSGSTTFLFNANYKDDLLYRVSCEPKLVDKSKQEVLWSEMEANLTEKYGDPQLKYIDGECTGVLWLKGQILVEQKCWEGEQVIEYSDATILKDYQEVSL